MCPKINRPKFLRLKFFASNVTPPRDKHAADKFIYLIITLTGRSTYHNLLAFYQGLEPYIADRHDQDCHNCNKTDDNHSKLATSLDKHWNNLSTEIE